MYEDSLKRVTFTDFLKDNFLKVIIMFSLVFILILGMFIHLLKKAFATGMSGHIAKPIDIEKVGAVILSVLKKQESLQTGKNNSMSK